MTTATNTTKTTLTTRQAIGYVGAGVATLVGFVPLAIRATGGAIETLDNKLLDNSLRDDKVLDQLLGQSRVHDKMVNLVKGYAAGMLESTTIKSKAKSLLDEEAEEVIVTPSKTKAEEVKKDESIFNN